MATPIEMPKLGNTVEDCLLAKWIRVRGDSVSAGDVVAEIETDKATFEVPAPADGVVLETFFPEGALVPVFANICVIGQHGESVAEFAPKAEVNGAPLAPQPAEHVEVTRGLTLHDGPEHAFVSPRARRFAHEHGMETRGIRGSGPNGRILEHDLREVYYSSPRQSPLARRRAAEAATPLSGIREKIARRMRDSLAHTAQYTLHGSADATALLSLRSRIKVRREELRLPDITLNELVLFCTLKALLRMPQLNAELKDGALHVHERVHLGFAADTERGLMVPVIKDAHTMTVADLAIEAKALAGRAVKGGLLPDDLSGATFTVSNLGGLGIEAFTPILNAPQVAILGVDSIQLRAVRIDGRITFSDRIGLSLTCDHQVIDGAPGARFLGVLRECIEDVEALCQLQL